MTTARQYRFWLAGFLLALIGVGVGRWTARR